MINVCYSSSDSYARIMAVSICSLLENNKKEFINIFVLDNGISDENKNKINIMVSKYNCLLKFVDITMFKNKTTHIKINDRWNFATFGRLFVSELLPDIDKIIHIDCDTIILKSIASLRETDITNKAVAGVEDCLSPLYRKCLKKEKNAILYNAGILLMNLKFIRDNDIERKFLEKINTSSRLLYLDQDIINGVINEDDKILLHPRFNAYSLLFYSDYKEIIYLRNSKKYYSEKEICEAINNPTIVHFTTSNFDVGRPWNTNNNHPYRQEFLKYLSLTSFANIKMNDCNVNLKTKMFRKMPRKICVIISRTFNAKLKPIIYKNK